MKTLLSILFLFVCAFAHAQYHNVEGIRVVGRSDSTTISNVGQIQFDADDDKFRFNDGTGWFSFLKEGASLPYWPLTGTKALTGYTSIEGSSFKLGEAQKYFFKNGTWAGGDGIGIWLGDTTQLMDTVSASPNAKIYLVEGQQGLLFTDGIINSLRMEFVPFVRASLIFGMGGAGNYTRISNETGIFKTSSESSIHLEAGDGQQNVSQIHLNNHGDIDIRSLGATTDTYLTIDGGTGITMGAGDGTFARLNITYDDGLVYEDSTTNSYGIRYSGVVIPTDSTLVTKAYVDGKVLEAGGGWPLTGTASLTGATTINGGGTHDLSFGSSGSRLDDLSVYADASVSFNVASGNNLNTVTLTSNLYNLIMYDTDGETIDVEILISTGTSDIINISKDGSLVFSIDENGHIRYVNPPTDCTGLDTNTIWSDSGTLKLCQ